jgi:hypothetical protein
VIEVAVILFGLAGCDVLLSNVFLTSVSQFLAEPQMVDVGLATFRGGHSDGMYLVCEQANNSYMTTA